MNVRYLKNRNFLTLTRKEQQFQIILRCASLAFLTFGIMASAPFSLFAQNSSTTGAIVGDVRNSAGEAIPGASINLKDTSTNQTRQVSSESDGSYRVASLPVGSYEVRAESAGFAPFINPQVTIALGQTTTLEIVLQPLGVNEVVTVENNVPVIDSAQTASTTSIDPERIEELPVNSRNYLEFTLLAPGVAPSNNQSSAGGTGAGATLPDSGFTFGGLRPRSNSISIDGLDNTDETTGAARVALSPEIVREFQIVNNGLSAEFGGAAGGVINVVTKTGTNEFHGDVFTFLQNERFNARGPISDSNSTRPRFRRLQPGGALGGPIKRDRAFIYAAIEQEHLTAQDESEISRSVRQRINSLLGAGTAPRSTVRNLSNALFPTGTDETEAAAKFTYLLNSFNTLDMRFAYTNLRDRGDAFGTDSLTDVSARGSGYTKDYQFTGALVSVLSPRIINDFRFQASTRRALSKTGDSLGAGVEIVGLARFGRPFEGNSDRREKRLQLLDNVSFSKGKSEWKTGATINRVTLKTDAQDGFGSIYIFRNLDDFAGNRPAIWRQSFGDSQTNFGVTNFGAYLQNQLRLSKKLTLNLGGRYDVERLPAPFRTDKNNFSPRVGLAWSPSSKSVVRAGFGIYYDRLPLAFLNRAIEKNGSQSFEQAAFDEQAARIYIANQGGRASLPVAGIAPSVYRADPNFSTPYSIQAHLGFEQALTEDVTFRADYLFTKGINLPRTRNINLLPPVILTAANASALGIVNPTPQQIGRFVFGTGRANPNFDAVYQLEDTAQSTYNGLSLTLNKRLSNEFELSASYTLSKTTDDASDFDEQPANPFDLRAERALSRQDVRNRFVLSALFDLPFGDEEDKKAESGRKENLLDSVLSNIEIAPIITLSSGRPVNPLTGTDEERSRAFPLASRPLGLARNSLHTPKFVNFDVRALKYFPFGEKRRLDLVVEVFNLFNRPNASAINSFYGSGNNSLPNFEMPTAFSISRQVRFSIDFEF